MELVKSSYYSTNCGVKLILKNSSGKQITYILFKHMINRIYTDTFDNTIIRFNGSDYTDSITVKDKDQGLLNFLYHYL